MKTIQAYRFAFDLTPSQQRNLLAHAGAARVAHNWALARVKAVMDQRAAERTYGVPDDLLTESVSWSLPALRKAWNAAKPGWRRGGVKCPKRRSTPAWTPWPVAIRVEPDRKHVVLPRLGRLKLHEYQCATCGLVIDRDRIASLNLAALAAQFDTAGNGPVAARGADQKTRIRGQVAMKRERGTAPAGQTGTVLPQGRTADRALTKAH